MNSFHLNKLTITVIKEALEVMKNPKQTLGEVVTVWPTERGKDIVNRMLQRHRRVIEENRLPPITQTVT